MKTVGKKRILIWLTSVVFVLAIWTVLGNTSVKLNYISLTCKILLSEFSGYKIAQISDLHNAEFGDNNAVFSGHVHGGQFRIPFIGGEKNSTEICFRSI